MRRIIVLTLGLLALTASEARAYDAATTHAGMTERAALSGQQLHGYLKAVHGLPLGVLDPDATESRVDRSQERMLASRNI